MLFQYSLLITIATGAWAQTQYTSTASTAVAKAAATALTLSPTSSVSGNTFDRFVQIWLENTDYSAAIGNGMSCRSSSDILPLVSKDMKAHIDW